VPFQAEPSSRTKVTLIPVPKGQGRSAGLLSVDLPSTGRRGRSYTVVVRQLTEVSAVLPPPPPPIQIAEKRAPEVSAPPKPFTWRQVLGAFQYTTTVKPGGELLFPQERLLAWLKWRIGVTPPTSRWLPVLQRYLNLTEGLVLTYGGDPTKIPSSQTGNVPGKGPPPPAPPLPPIGEREITGKVVAIDYDRFGDFCGFTILSEHGRERRFHAREPQIEDVGPAGRARPERVNFSTLGSSPAAGRLPNRGQRCESLYSSRGAGAQHPSVHPLVASRGW
jgi:hypothetical protein